MIAMTVMVEIQEIQETVVVTDEGTTVIEDLLMIEGRSLTRESLLDQERIVAVEKLLLQDLLLVPQEPRRLLWAPHLYHTALPPLHPQLRKCLNHTSLP